MDKEAIQGARRALLLKKLEVASTTKECTLAFQGLKLYRDDLSIVATRKRAIELAASAGDMDEVRRFPYDVGIFSLGDQASEFFRKAMLLCRPEEVYDFTGNFGYYADEVVSFLVEGLTDPLKLTRLAMRLGAEGLLERGQEVIARAAELAASWEVCGYVGTIHYAPLPTGFLTMAVLLAEGQKGYDAPLEVCGWMKASLNDPLEFRQAAAVAELLDAPNKRIRRVAGERIRQAYQEKLSGQDGDFYIQSAWNVVCDARDALPELAAELTADLVVRLTDAVPACQDFSEAKSHLEVASAMEDFGIDGVYWPAAMRAMELAEGCDDILALVRLGIHVQELTEAVLVMAATEDDIIAVIQRNPNFSGEWTLPLCERIFDYRRQRAQTIEDFMILHHLTKDPVKLAEVEDRIQELIAPYHTEPEE